MMVLTEKALKAVTGNGGVDSIISQFKFTADRNSLGNHHL